MYLFVYLFIYIGLFEYLFIIVIDSFIFISGRSSLEVQLMRGCRWWKFLQVSAPVKPAI